MRSTPTIKIKQDTLIPKLGGRNRPLRACQKTGQVAHTAGDYADKYTKTPSCSLPYGGRTARC
jgi:hypothetical protein